MLSEFQRKFANDLLDDTDGIQLEGFIDDSSGSARGRLSIYQNNVSSSLIDALSEMYSVVARLMGERSFRGLARRYVLQHPPVQPDLTFYGELFPEFLKNELEKQALSDYGYLTDVALLEWKQNLSFHAEDSSPLDVNRLTEVEASQLDNVVLGVCSDVQLMQSVFPVVEIWQENRKELPDTLNLDAMGGCNVLIFRKNYSVQLVELTLPAYQLLEYLASGMPIGESLQNMAEFLPEDELTPLLSWLLGLSIFSDFKI